MGLKIKFKKEGHKFLVSYKLIIGSKTSGIATQFKDKIGTYQPLPGSRKSLLLFNKKKIIFWRDTGLKNHKKLHKKLHL